MAKPKSKGPFSNGNRPKAKKKSVFQVGKVTKKTSSKHTKANSKKNAQKSQDEIEKMNEAYDDIRERMLQSSNDGRKLERKLVDVRNKKRRRTAKSKVDLEKTLDEMEMLCRTKIDIAK